ncbi:hypothetical protein STRTUCAR8_08672, partial [Streptomyces turgidiscabies Car8]
MRRRPAQAAAARAPTAHQVRRTLRAPCVFSVVPLLMRRMG